MKRWTGAGWLLACAMTVHAQPRFEAVDAHVQGMVDRYRLPGAVLLVAQHGDTVHARTFGRYDLDARIPVASASKWLSATVIARLVDQRVLDWDAPIAAYAPDVPADKATLTLRQLFSMTSGLPGGDLVGAAPCLDDRTTTLDACARSILALPSTAAPGSVFDYGGNSMQVGAWIAERATGTDWNALFRRELAAPLGLQATDYGPRRGVDVGNPRIAGGIHTTAGDYLRLLQLHLEDGRFAGRRLLDAATVADMQRLHTAGTRTLNSPHPTAAGYGLGHWIDVIDADGHASELSSPGAFGTVPWIDTRAGVAGVLLVDGIGALQRDDSLRLIELVGAALAADTARVPFADFGGLWWNAAEAGSGITLVQQADHGLLATWYTFDDAGDPLWLFATGRWTSSTQWSGTLYRTDYAGRDGLRTGVDPARIATAAVGTLVLTFDSATNATWRARIGTLDRTFAIERFPPLPPG